MKVLLNSFHFNEHTLGSLNTSIISPQCKCILREFKSISRRTQKVLGRGRFVHFNGSRENQLNRDSDVIFCTWFCWRWYGPMRKRTFRSRGRRKGLGGRFHFKSGTRWCGFHWRYRYLLTRRWWGWARLGSRSRGNPQWRLGPRWRWRSSRTVRSFWEAW